MKTSPTGNLTTIAGTDARSGNAYQHAGFVPHNLDAMPNLSQSAWKALADAREGVARLDQIVKIAGAKDLGGWMSAPLLRREAQSTSALEGTFEPMREVLALDYDDKNAPSTAMREIFNYVKAATYAFDLAKKKRRLTLGHICELQGMLVRDTPSGQRDPGKVRTTQVAIGSPTSSVEDARFVPMPPGIGLEAALGALVEWGNASGRAERDPIADAALAHYQFESLHPFTDGNGRIGRMLVVRSLLERGILSEPLLTISPWLERHDSEYRDRLYEVSATGDWSGWVEFFAQAVRLSARDVEHRIARVQTIAEAMVASAQGGRSGTLKLRLPNLLVRSPFVTVASVARELECSKVAAGKAIDRFVARGYLAETTGGNYGRKYAATEIVEALVAPVDDTTV